MTKQERARFDAVVEVTRTTAIYADGHAVMHPPGEGWAFRPVDRENFLKPIEMVEFSFKQRGVSPLHAVPPETLSAAAKFGQAVFASGINVTVEDRPERFAREVHDRLLVSLQVDYTITVRRMLDA